MNLNEEKWVVYDEKTKKRLPSAGKTWATHRAANTAAKKLGGKVASAEWYFDKIQEETTVNTGVQASGEAHGKAFGKPYFKCDTKTFEGCLKGRRKGKHWKSFTGNEEVAQEIRAYLKKNPKEKSVMLRNGDAPHFIMANRVMF